MFELPALPYRYDALEPVLSEATLRLHHDKHHAKYVEMTNSLLQAQGLPSGSLEDLIGEAAMAPDRRLFNNAAQAWNHAFFWRSMTPEPIGPAAGLMSVIKAGFGDLATLGRAFIEEGAAHFGSGWVWLAAEGERLSIFSTHDADTVVTRDLTPLLVCDLWEHAYYLDHQNDRVGFLTAWWNKLANWSFAETQYAAEIGGEPGWRYPSWATHDRPAIADQAAYELALEEVMGCMEHPPHPRSADGQRLAGLLEAIARFQADTEGRPRPSILPKQQSPLAVLESQIGQAARAWADAHPDDSRHWSPMLGGY